MAVGLRTIFIWNLFRSFTYICAPLVIIFNFYGLFTHKFYWLKPDNFILPAVILIHMGYQREIQKRISRNKGVDFFLQKFEFAMYGVVLIYGFELIETIYTMFLAKSYDSSIFPETFWSQAFMVLSIQMLFILFTVCSFYLRKLILGRYNFDYIGQSRGIAANSQ